MGVKDLILLKGLLGHYFGLKVFFTGDELVCYVKKSSDLIPLISCLKHHTEFQFSQLMDLYAVDYPSRQKRYEVHYLLLSLTYNQRLRLKLEIELEEMIPSIASLYPSGNWLEREVWDMFGIFFANHPDLRRILTDYGFEGFPLRKDFPVTGFLEVRYDESEKRIQYEPVELTQEYRLFQFLSPWEK